jgi:transketolase
VFNKEGFPLITNHTYVFCGDGCLQEGVSAEAASLAGHLGLNKLIVFYDDNKITIDGETELAFTEDVALRFKSYGWHTITVEKGSSLLFFLYFLFSSHMCTFYSHCTCVLSILIQHG